MLNAYAIVRHLMEADGDEPLPPEPPEVQQGQQQDLGLAGDDDAIDAYLLDPTVATERYLKTKPTIKGSPTTGLYLDWKRRWFLGGRPRRDGPELLRKLENNTWAVYYNPIPDQETDDNRWIAIKLHNTHILTVYPDDTLVASMGGWNTVTTRDRMNRHLPGSWGVYTISGSAYWYCRSVPSITGDTAMFRIPFQSGDKILADGTLVYQSEHEHVRRRKAATYYVHFREPVDLHDVDYNQPEGTMGVLAGPYPSKVRAERHLRRAGGNGYISKSPAPAQ
jgi:hypothetical protein